MLYAYRFFYYFLAISDYLLMSILLIINHSFNAGFLFINYVLILTLYLSKQYVQLIFCKTKRESKFDSPKLLIFSFNTLG